MSGLHEHDAHDKRYSGMVVTNHVPVHVSVPLFYTRDPISTQNVRYRSMDARR